MKKYKKLKLVIPLTLMGLMGISTVATVNKEKLLMVKADNEPTELVYKSTDLQNNNVYNLLLNYNEGNYESLNIGVIVYAKNTQSVLMQTGITPSGLDCYEEEIDIDVDKNGNTVMVLTVDNNGYKGNWENISIGTYPETQNIDITITQQNTNTDLYSYLVNEYVEPQPTPPSSETIGTQIINSIKSGLGLISDLASEFLLGFSALFWNATNSSLTTFGMFALVMLGVGITFAVIKLCLNILRSNTGA